MRPNCVAVQVFDEMPLTPVVLVSVPLCPGRWWVSLKGRSTSSAAALRRTFAVMDVSDCSSGPSPSKRESFHRQVSQLVWGRHLHAFHFSFFSGMPLRLRFYVTSDWWLLQANGSARVRLGATEIIASVKVRVCPHQHFAANMARRMFFYVSFNPLYAIFYSRLSFQATLMFPRQ